MSDRTHRTDVALIGGGIMSATLGALLRRLEPRWDLTLFEAQDALGTESTNAWNNAGTGHAALCELNYMPEGPGGALSADKAISINAQFQQSREFWSALVEDGSIADPASFISAVPHMSFVRGEGDADYLRRRHELLVGHPLFAGLEYSTDPRRIAAWAPLLVDGRPATEPIAATRSTAGTDVDFGRLAELLIHDAQGGGLEIRLGTKVVDLRQQDDGQWRITTSSDAGRSEILARFVFVGAGGAALPLLQRAGVREARGYGGFPISGVFLRSSAPEVVDRHHAKVYGKASVGAPPMSVPHLDTRIIDGRRSVMFGPYAGFSPKFLKSGRWTDLPGSVRGHNLATMVGTGVGNLDLITYLLKELTASRATQLDAVRAFLPTARAEDWELITAGQRVQVMKADRRRGGALSFGTEVITAADGSIAGLLGASPGASTAVTAMLDVLTGCFPSRMPLWRDHLAHLVPSAISPLIDDASLASASIERTARALGLDAAPTRTTP